MPGRPKKKRKGTMESIYADADKRQKPAAAAPAAVPEAQAQAEAAPKAGVQAKRQAPVAKAQLPAKKARQNHIETRGRWKWPSRRSARGRSAH